MHKTIVRIGAAALVAGLIVFVTSGAPKANAPDVERAPPQSIAKANRLAVAVRGAACSQRAWPNFEQSCQYDLRQPASEARAVRVIALR